MVAWGWNRYGQTDVPAGLTGVKAVSAGSYHSLALKNDGTVVAWGYNGNGQTDIPAGLTGVKAVSAGGLHSLALVDLEPPGPIEAFDATPADEEVSLSWIKPPDTDLATVRILRSTTGPATSPDPGATQTQVYEGTGETFTDDNLTNGTTYYYTAFAKDAIGNWSARTTARATPRDLTPPDTTLDSGPSGSVSNTTAAFDFSSEAGATFRCSLDDAPFTDCQSGVAYSGLSEGAHAFVVRAVDAAGNADPDPARRSWTVDTTAPNTAITDAPSGMVSGTTATFDFLASEPGSSFECSLDGAAFAGCSPPETYVGLSDGMHELRVRATDAVGNVDTSPALRSWTVDATAPTVSAVKPLEGATGIAPSANVLVDFSEKMDAETINATTVRLTKAGSTTRLPATVSYNATRKRAILDPKATLLSGTTYVARVRTRVYDKAGNRLDQDPATTGLQPKVWMLTIR